MKDQGWGLLTRSVGSATRKLFNLEFNEVMSIGCRLISRFPGSDAVSLTFDDGPTAHSTQKILSALEQYGVRGTFFCVGRNAVRHASIVKDIVLRGHEVANHTLSHPDLHRALPHQLRLEITACHQILSSITKSGIVSFRAPYGHFRWDMRYISHFSGELALVHWDVAPPFSETEPAIISDYVMERVSKGSIVDLHDGVDGANESLSFAVGNATANCLHTMIPALLARGFRILTISDQLKENGLI